MPDVSWDPTPDVSWDPTPVAACGEDRRSLLRTRQNSPETRAESLTSFRATNPSPSAGSEVPVNAHDLPIRVARPRGFEPLTFGSVDRRGSARFGSSKPFRLLRRANKAPEIRIAGQLDRCQLPLRVGTLAPGGERTQGPRQVRRLPLVPSGRESMRLRNARSHGMRALRMAPVCVPLRDDAGSRWRAQPVAMLEKGVIALRCPSIVGCAGTRRYERPGTRGARRASLSSVHAGDPDARDWG